MAASHAKTQMSLLLLALLTLVSSTPALSNLAQPSVYEVLEKFGLPSGLLPDSVASYTFSLDDGSFVVELKKPCYIKFDYLVYYSTKITGNLNFGVLSNLGGIQVQSFFLWLNVDEIRVDSPNSDGIYFTMGIIKKKLGIKQFQQIRSCRDNAVAACEQSSELVSQLPVSVDEVDMLVAG